MDAVDVANVGWLDSLNSSIKKCINFQKVDIDNFDWDTKKYDVVVVLRVIQYLSSDQLQDLIKNIQKHLTDQGSLLISYTSKGGIHNKSKIDVPKFSYDIKYVKELLEKYFIHVHILKGATSSVHVGYNEPVESYDIICSKSVVPVK